MNKRELKLYGRRSFENGVAAGIAFSILAVIFYNFLGLL